MKSYQITSWCHHFMKEQIQKGDICIDATAGQGYDTLLLCQLVGETGKVIAFDIQPEAIDQTEKRLIDHQMEYRATLLLESHSQMKQYAKENSVSCIVFNFGYLPGKDHKISTTPKTSLEGIEQGLHLLKKKGMMSLCIYSGRETGYEERQKILEYLETLDPKKYLVILSSYYNRPNDPPIPVQIYKL